MKNIWKHKWVVMPVAVAIILAVGAVAAVALADPGNGASTATSAQLVTTTTAPPSTGDATQALSALGQRGANLQQRLEQLRARWARIRAKMTPADQAAFDQLLGTAKDQRQALQKARQDLAGTLKQMRALVQKYQPTTTT